MKKKLNETTITNELKSGSFFFSPSKEGKESEILPVPQKPKKLKAEHANTRTGERANGRTPARVNVRTSKEIIHPKSQNLSKREIVRHSFQFYKDQISRLKMLRAHKELLGETSNLSDLVRDAIDAYLEKSEHPNG